MRFLLSSTSKLLLVILCCAVACVTTTAQKKPPAKKTAGAPTPTPTDSPAPVAEDEEALKAELDAIKDLPVGERIARLEAFVAAHPNSTSRPRALELLTGARAALGDEKLRTGDRRGGVELFRKIVGDVSAETSDRLFVEIVAKLPANLYLLGEREAGAELAREVEQKAAGNVRRLLSVASFYLGFELSDDAVRVGEEAVRVAPDAAAAHQALGAAYRMALRLEEAAQQYARALELDQTSKATRRSLADLLRATGKAEDALALYRAHLAAEPSDAGARAGLVLSLFDAGRKDEAESEMQKTLAEQPENLQLLVGAAYHFASEGQGARALEFARRAVNLEPRAQWVWARLAVARALLAEKRPLDAERAVRLARDLGRFPTLDYELAAALAATGLYDEAAEELAKSFALRDGRIETYLAGRTLTRGADFLELLAPERRASTFRHKAIDTPESARILKGLLAFHLASGSGANGAVDEKAIAEAAREFATGDDAMRAFRELYVAGKLLERNAALSTVVERTDEAMSGVDAAIDAPSAVVALLADELRDARTQARAANAAVNVPAVPRELLSKILRGRIEELAGWAFYKQGNAAEAVVRLKRAVSVLPENSYWWRSAEWRLGAALESAGSGREALAAYVRAYRLAPDPAHRSVIETLYRRLNNGSDNGLERLLTGQTETAAADTRPAQPFTLSKRADEKAELDAALKVLADAKTNAPKPPATSDTPAAQASTEPAPAQASPSPTPSEELSKQTPAPTPEATPAPTETPRAEAETPEAVKPAATAPIVATEKTAARAEGEGVCALSLSESVLSLKAGGGPVVVTASLSGGGDLSKLKATTVNWADIVIFAEPRREDEAAQQRFSVSSISGKAGNYTVTINSSCGKRDVQVEVK